LSFNALHSSKHAIVWLSNAYHANTDGDSAPKPR